MTEEIRKRIQHFFNLLKTENSEGFVAEINGFKTGDEVNVDRGNGGCAFYHYFENTPGWFVGHETHNGIMFTWIYSPEEDDVFPIKEGALIKPVAKIEQPNKRQDLYAFWEVEEFPYVSWGKVCYAKENGYLVVNPNPNAAGTLIYVEPIMMFEGEAANLQIARFKSHIAARDAFIQQSDKNALECVEFVRESADNIIGNI